MNKRIQIRLNKDQKEAFVEVAKVVLRHSLLGLAIGVFLTSPSGLSKAIPEIINLRKKYGNKVVDKSLNKIFKDKYVRLIKKDEQTLMKITEKGRSKLVSFNIDTIKITETKWDGTWKFVIFDIPECRMGTVLFLRTKYIFI